MPPHGADMKVGLEVRGQRKEGRKKRVDISPPITVFDLEANQGYDVPKS